MTLPVRNPGIAAALRRHRTQEARPSTAGHPDVATLRAAPQQIIDVRNRYRDERAAASQAVALDARLSPQGITDRTVAAVAAVTDRFRGQLETIWARAARAAEVARIDEADARPEPDDTLEGIALRAVKRGDAERLHAAGISTPTQINEATDTEVVFALIEMIPVVLRIAGADSRTIAVHLAHAERRLHELGGSLDAYDAAREIEERVAELDGSFAIAFDEIGQSLGERRLTLHGAIESSQARQLIRSRNQEALNLREHTED